MPLLLDQDVQHLALTVQGPPEINAPAAKSRRPSLRSPRPRRPGLLYRHRRWNPGLPGLTLVWRTTSGELHANWLQMSALVYWRTACLKAGRGGPGGGNWGEMVWRRSIVRKTARDSTPLGCRRFA